MIEKNFLKNKKIKKIKTFYFILFFIFIFSFNSLAYDSKYDNYNDDTKLLAALIYAEAGIEDWDGKVYVADSVLNRVNSSDPYWPDSIYDVIYQKGQYSCVNDGNLKKAFKEVTDECFEIAIQELNAITNTDIIYFRTGHYSKWGEPLFKHGRHYFSKGE